MRKNIFFYTSVIITLIAAFLTWRVIDQAITIDYMKQGRDDQHRICLSLIQVSNTVLDLADTEIVIKKLLEQNGVQRKDKGLLVGDIELERSNGKMHVRQNSCGN